MLKRISTWYSYHELEKAYKEDTKIKSIRYTSAVIMFNILWRLRKNGLRQFVRPVKDYRDPQVEYSATMFRNILKKGSDSRAKKLLIETGAIEKISNARFNAGPYSRGQLIGILISDQQLIDLDVNQLNYKKIAEYNDWFDTLERKQNNYYIPEELLDSLMSKCSVLRSEGIYAYANKNLPVSYEEYYKFDEYFNDKIAKLQLDGKLGYVGRFYLRSIKKASHI